MSFDFSTLITDRTQADVSRVRDIAKRISNGTASEAEVAEFNSATMRGAYNYTDLNRVNMAIEEIHALLDISGYAVPGYKKNRAWYESDVPTMSDMTTYLTNVEAIRAVLPMLSTSPNTPEDMDGLTLDDANNIEQILVDVEMLIQWMIASYRPANAPGFYSGASPLPT